MRDFFISYTRSDQAWADWLAASLMGMGYSALIQAHDAQPGTDIALEMRRGASEARRTIAVISKAYLVGMLELPEWETVLSTDSTGSEKVFLPIRVEQCNLTGLLQAIVYVDLVGLSEREANFRLSVSLKDHPGFPQSSLPSRNQSVAYPQPDSAPPVQWRKNVMRIKEGLRLLDSMPGLLASELTSYSVVVFDVDGMGGINRNFGKAAGDAVLAHLMSLSKTDFSDSHVGRCGNDTFFVVVKASSSTALELLKQFSTLVGCQDWSGIIADGLKVSISGSVAAFTTDEPPAETVLRAALGCRDARMRGLGKSVPAPRFLSSYTRDSCLTSESGLSDAIREIHS